jgi:hypothetical protein
MTSPIKPSGTAPLTAPAPGENSGGGSAVNQPPRGPLQTHRPVGLPSQQLTFPPTTAYGAEMNARFAINSRAFQTNFENSSKDITPLQVDPNTGPQSAENTIETLTQKVYEVENLNQVKTVLGLIDALPAKLRGPCLLALGNTLRSDRSWVPPILKSIENFESEGGQCAETPHLQSLVDAMRNPNPYMSVRQRRLDAEKTVTEKLKAKIQDVSILLKEAGIFTPGEVDSIICIGARNRSGFLQQKVNGKHLENGAAVEQVFRDLGLDLNKYKTTVLNLKIKAALNAVDKQEKPLEEVLRAFEGVEANDLTVFRNPTGQIGLRGPVRFVGSP